MDAILIPLIAFAMAIIPLGIGTLLLEWLDKTKSPFGKNKYKKPKKK
ncbi:hypothetical protein J6T21_01655 [Candidatus Saccharibacteria bacterium]|nr:hypothetical protein [Candidatus Saccharibacteria bacterium]